MFCSLDLDECSLVPKVCDSNALCSNTNGSFQCTCDSGFTGNGSVCHGISLLLVSSTACHITLCSLQTSMSVTLVFATRMQTVQTALVAFSAHVEMAILEMEIQPVLVGNSILLMELILQTN